MSKNINVAGHIARYEDTDLKQVLELVTGLNELVERRRASTISDLEEKLAMLKNGQIPVEEKAVQTDRPKRTRGGKKVATEETEEA